MAAAADPDHGGVELVESEEPFRTNALLIILKALKLSHNRPHSFVFVDEILHSIFFLGNINTPPHSPKDIVNVPEVFEALLDCYPRPFKLFSSQVPKRSPFSCVLDMVVQVTREQEREQEERNIIRQLRNIINEVDPSGSRKLISSTICVSQRENSPLSTRYYGVSMSTHRRQIPIGASCLSNWQTFVANAVMTYYPHMTKKPYFDGTFTLKPEVRCVAFDLLREQEEEMAEEVVKPPCRSCGNLYGLATREVKEFTYGNCAEAESLSNLLRNERASTIISSRREYSERNLQRAKTQVENDLKSFLKMPQDIRVTFYTPETE
ncbi:uncharacterized protein LOC115428538 [Sphaeramia orbicularis]|uniref:uncharacterized protein LOC115428538 n=1 Tax=Sphaeramia orbicularis TaxID=375764 RepID=UPI00117F51B8|nr:uncharacterized protein LOC115428538 [Sphaeramia orbicularis]